MNWDDLIIGGLMLAYVFSLGLSMANQHQQYEIRLNDLAFDTLQLQGVFDMEMVKFDAWLP